MPERPAVRRDLVPFGTTIFAEMTALAQKHGAVNLSQGFPDFDGPEFVRLAASKAIMEGPNQYARSMGLPQFVEAVAAKVRRHYGVELDPYRQVTVFSGATEGLFSSFIGLLEPGDEVILFEPFYDSYPVCTVLAGATPRYCTLRWPDFTFDREELTSLFSDRTRLVVLNTPHNPSGKVYTREELSFVGSLCEKRGAYLLTDEVYEHLTYGVDHVPAATLPGLSERTLTISSTGKTFSLTGWKIGYAWGPEELVAAAQAAHQFVTFATATPLQWAMAQALAAPGSFYEGLTKEYTERRDFLVCALREAGFEVAEPSGTYFVMADISRFGFEDDFAFARHLTKEVGVACIPPSVFYAKEKAQGRRLARFAFCKKMETLKEAARRLGALKKRA
jgi:N-succinyldiaminopimelate aminotransferase